MLPSPVICPMDSGSVPDSAVECSHLRAPTVDTPQPLSLSHTAPISHTRLPPPKPPSSTPSARPRMDTAENTQSTPHAQEAHMYCNPVRFATAAPKL